MNKNKIIKLTNSLSLISIILLLYWVFIFISIQVFGFKIFRQNMTESFYLSIFGILALLFGAVIVNIMLNLTKISEVMSGEYENDSSKKFKSGKRVLWLFLLSFPLIFALLYFGDYRSSRAKENYLVESAKYVVENNQEIMSEFCSVKIDSAFIAEISPKLAVLSRENESFPSISLIRKTEFMGKSIYIRITDYSYWRPKTDITQFIYPCSPDEKEYLQSIFAGQNNEYKFSSYDGHYELYYPLKVKGNIFVLYFNDYQRYGKIGS